MNTPIVLDRQKAFIDKFREYNVLIDGSSCGSIRNGGRFEYSISPGTHTLSLTVDWCSSNELSFQAKSNTPLIFVCSSNLRGFRSLLAGFYLALAPSKWIKVWRVE